MYMHTYDWQKSSYCQEGDACVHVAATHEATILLTESADPARGTLTTTPETFAALLRALKDGRSPAPRSGLILDHTGETVRLSTPTAPEAILTTTRTKWETFVRGVRAGEFDHFGEFPQQP
ncbi:DUF397 domain-containing protein [Streptomyces monticola]|uniref:DUF397 domain-containing protein n=1 Tax=Streptomyces monticola TaxID=2666263 RepID=A0ABW2JIB5_9ACTN